MFELSTLPATEEISGFDESALVDAVSDGLRLERAAGARKIFAAAELFYRREALQDDREQWRIDGWDSVAAEVGAAQGISRYKAGAQIQLGVCLREDLPLTGAKFADGLIDYWILDLVMSRIALLSPADKARIDKVLADRVTSWNRLSRKKVTALIDSWVVQLDALAKREPRSREEGRCIGFGPEGEGVAEVWGSVRAPAAAAVDARLNALAATVCDRDSRTTAQLRADAIEAMAAGSDRMPCECGHADCAAAANPPASPVVIHVVADAATVYGKAKIPGYLPGYGGLPADLVRAYLRNNPKMLKVATPEQLSDCEPGYHPTQALRTYVKLRDVTCRFPYCDAPAEVCDVDHSVPWPYGPTHASNLKLLCRHHHLLKSFYGGARGWNDVQHPDGTVEWTAPTGHTYTTKPTGAQYFPQFAAETARLSDLPPRPPEHPLRGALMPKRDRTRNQDRRARINEERARNQQRLNDERLGGERSSEPAEHFACDMDPPPF